MKIASLYPSMRGKEVLYPTFYWDFVRAILHHSEEITDYHVFLPLDCYPPIGFPEISKVFVHNVMELQEFFQENSVDIWHDFGYTDVSYLTHIRKLSHQNFPITMVIHPWRLVSESIEFCDGLTEYDALICSKPETCKIVGSTHQHPHALDLVPDIFTIPQGIDTSKIRITDKSDARYLLNLSEKVIIILCLADFSVYKGGDLFPLIHTFHILTEKYEKIRLIISGPDNYTYAKQLQKLIDDSLLSRHILLRPNATESAQSLLFSASDIFISPSDTIHSDNQIQILRAMSNSLPIIATDDDEKGIIEHAKNGLKIQRICKPSSYESLNDYFPLVSDEVKPLILSQGIVVDPQQMIEYLTLLIEDSDLRQTLGEAAYHYVATNHQWSIIVEKYVRLWCTLRDKMGSKVQDTIELENQMENRFSQLSGGNINDLFFFSNMSRDIKDNTLLKLTTSGETLLETEHLISYDAMKDIIYRPVVFEILNLARSATTMSEIVNSLLQLTERDDTDNLVPNITYHIMWCIKQGFIVRNGKV